MDDKEKAAAVLGGCAVIFLPTYVATFMAVFLLARGFMISVLWAWFMVPTFSLPVLSIPQAIGLSLVVGAFHSSHGPSKDREWYVTLAIAVGDIVLPLAIGWIVRMWM